MEEIIYKKRKKKIKKGINAFTRDDMQNYSGIIDKERKFNLKGRREQETGVKDGLLSRINFNVKNCEKKLQEDIKKLSNKK